jgi:hypothetical protein
VGDQRPLEEEGQVGDILGLTRQMGGPGGRDRDRYRWQDVVQDGEVVHGEIPDDVDVVLEQAEVHARGVVVVHLAQIARLDERSHRAHGRRVDERVIDEDHASMGLGQAPELGGFVGRGGHGLLDPDMFARLEGAAGQVEMRRHGRGQRHGLHLGVVEHRLE